MEEQFWNAGYRLREWRSGEEEGIRCIPVYLKPGKEMNGICENRGVMWEKFLCVEGNKLLFKDFNGSKEEAWSAVSELNALKGFVNLWHRLCGCSDIPILFLLW